MLIAGWHFWNGLEWIEKIYGTSIRHDNIIVVKRLTVVKVMDHFVQIATLTYSEWYTGKI